MAICRAHRLVHNERLGNAVSDVEFSDFTAYREHMSKTVLVQGTVTVTHAGFRVSMERAEPQGINPDDLVLMLVFQPDFEARPEQELVFSESWGDGQPPAYATASFRIEGPDVVGEVEPPQHITVTDVY